VALNISDDQLVVTLPDCGFRAARVLGGTGSPPPDTVERAVVAAHEWLILQAVR
jgi:cyclomaltodextrinase / maltogenic alpha-amylase / neopullulanase